MDYDFSVVWGFLVFVMVAWGFIMIILNFLAGIFLSCVIRSTHEIVKNKFFDACCFKKGSDMTIMAEWVTGTTIHKD